MGMFDGLNEQEKKELATSLMDIFNTARLVKQYQSALANLKKLADMVGSELAIAEADQLFATLRTGDLPIEFKWKFYEEFAELFTSLGSQPSAAQALQLSIQASIEALNKPDKEKSNV